jgi:putative spermidine/putrescine transport system permease protein
MSAVALSSRDQRERAAIRRPLPRLRLRMGAALSVLWCLLVYTLVLAPLIVVFGASFSGADTGNVVISYVEFPPRVLTLDWYFRIPAAQFEALALSTALAGATALGACVLGIPAAFGLVRGRFPGKGIVSALMRAPLQIPHVVVGIAFLQLFYAVDDLVGLRLQGTIAGMYLGHLFLATPFVIGTVGALLQRFNVRLEEAALTLGAGPWRTLRRVTLPVILPGVFTGGLYAFIVSFVDVPVSMFLSRPGLVTYPVELFYAMEHDFNPSSLASATLVTLFALALLLVAKRVVGLEALLRAGGT